ncbi:MAG: protein phosphatase CheZ [Alphaproteobacteria bacterium]|nr:protein phosphatase CheZ [Alphaproteobacteria bacterium]
MSQNTNRRLFTIEKRALGLPVGGPSLAEGMLSRIEDSLARIEAQMESMDERIAVTVSEAAATQAPVAAEGGARSSASDGEITEADAMMILGIDQDLLETAQALRDVDDQVRSEVAAMVRIVGQVRQEIASIAPQEEKDQVADATKELDAVVQATEEATHRILAAVENAEGFLKELEGRLEDEADRALVDRVGQEMVEILEASTFQDLTGQRIRKVVGTLDRVRVRVVNLVNILGPESLLGLETDGLEHEDDDEAGLLEGPQMDGAGLSQEDIDKLFD